MESKTMQAVRIREFGPPAALRVEQVPRPTAGPGELLIAVRAAGINPVDVKTVAGRLKLALPRTPGRDFAGVVIAGPESFHAMEMWGSGVGLGLTRDGTHAEFVVVAAEAVRPKPENLSMEQAGAVGTPYIVAQLALTRTAALQTGETVLVVGASGAVGRAAVQIAHWKQAHVIGADRQDANHSGADLHVNTQHQDLPDAVRSLTAGKGADVVLDAVGGPMFELALQSLAKGGRQIAIAGTGGTRVSFDLVDFYHNQSRLFGLDTLQLDAATLATILDDLRGGFEAGFLTPPAIKSYSLAQAVSAFEAVERGGDLSRHVLVSSFTGKHAL